MKLLRKLGPGLIFAGAAIGVSHLVQSTRAGADFGFGLLWALLLVNLFKYPFFQFGPRYAMATGESLIEGYAKLGKGLLIVCFVLSLGTMFTIQTAVTIVTAGLAVQLFGITTDVTLWSVIITLFCFFLLILGRYRLLDRLMKIIIITLSVTTLIALGAAVGSSENSFPIAQVFPQNGIELAFLIAFMGWMPGPLDISIWHSLWAVEKQKENNQIPQKKELLDFNVGYGTTVLLGIVFMGLGAVVMFGSGENFSTQGGVFAKQLIDLYTTHLGHAAFLVIALAAFTTMFSTTLTCLDASPRMMAQIGKVLKWPLVENYQRWLMILAGGTMIILVFYLSEMGRLVTVATVLSFLTAPFYAYANLKLLCSAHTPEAWRPNKAMRVLCVFGLVFLLGFSAWYLSSL